MSHAKQKLITDMNNVAHLEEESGTKQFLSEAICSDVQANIKCNTIENYEAADFVISNGVKLINYPHSDYELLSDVRYTYVMSILELLEQYLPEIRINDFDLLDQRLWNDEVQITNQIVNEKMESIMRELKIQTPRGISFKRIGNEMFKLIKTIRQLPKWCRIFESTPSMFWANILRDENLAMTPILRDIIRSSLAIPAGSAAAERSFGLMNYVKTAHRARLSPENINHIVRIRHNGPIVGGIEMEPYADKWLESHERCDALHTTTRVKAKKDRTGDSLDNEIVYSTIF